MLIVIEFFIKDQSELDSLELNSILSSSSELEEELEESELPLVCSEKVWNMLSVQHCIPLAFSSHSIYLESQNRENRGYNIVAFCAGARLGRDAKERTYGTLLHDICNTEKK